MSVRRLIRTIAGCTALASAALIYLVYGHALASSMQLSLPSLALNGGLSASGSLTSYQENPTLRIAKLGVEAPIVRDVTVNDKPAYEAALTGGVAQAKGSADLEAQSGNTFLFGHSSNISMRPTAFDSIFAGLPRLQPNDTLQLTVGVRTSTYAVETSQSVEASAVQYLSTEGDRRITLVTCWPRGTDYMRWVVQAKLAE
jgi:LPXTG-site transpeptidase (sortase) family protein